MSEDPSSSLPPIVVLTTGGTIDKTYFDALSKYEVGESVVQRLLEIGRVTYPFRIVEALRKDSLDLTPEDREMLRAKVTELATTRVVITHGTDTMTETARALAGVRDKTIVFTRLAVTGPIFGERRLIQSPAWPSPSRRPLPPGVYIAMSGQVFRADKVRKDHAAGRFVPLEA